MAILEPDDREVVRKYFEQKLTAPVRMVVFTETADETDVTAFRTGESSRQTQELVEELASLSDAIRLEIRDIGSLSDDEKARIASEWGILGTPTIAVGPAGDSGAPGSDGAPPGIRFAGYPGGYEFTSFLETLGSIAAENWGLTEETVALLDKVDRPIDIKTFVTPT